MKQIKNNILFIDKEVASKNFACYFLDNNKLFLLQDKTKKSENFSNFMFETKLKTKFDAIFIFSQIDNKQVENILATIKNDSVVITNNVVSYTMLTNVNVKVVYVSLDLKNDFNCEQKLTLLSGDDFEIEKFAPNINLKVDDKLLEKVLSNLIINNAVNSVAVINDKKIGSLLWQNKYRKVIINLIEEQIKITNSVLINVDIYNGFNFYKFLSGNNVLSNIKKHLKLFLFLSNEKNIDINKEELLNNINTILSLNYNKYVEIKFLNKIKEILISNN